MVAPNKNDNKNKNQNNASDYEAEQTGFAPYLKLEPGLIFEARVISVDDSGEFRRIHMQSYTDGLQCNRGTGEHLKQETVNEGDFFSMSSYQTLPLENYVGMRLRVVVKEKTPIKGGRTMWNFDLGVHKDDKKALIEQRAAAARELPPGMA